MSATHTSRQRRATQPVPAELDAYLSALYGQAPQGALVNLRYRLACAGMAQRFYRASERRRLATEIVRRGAHTDVFIGALPRIRRAGGRAGLGAHAWLLWADCDGAAAAAALATFDPAPAIVVCSGSGENRHAYWPLERPVSLADAERANRRLAHALGADPMVAQPAALLRPPATLNFKHNPPVAVAIESATRPLRFRVAEVAGALPDAPPPSKPARGLKRPEPRRPGEDPLLGISALQYGPALTGCEPNREGKISCPFHEDRTPSLHLYRAPERGWSCFGCGAGGSIYDLAAELWGSGTRGEDFRALRARLGECFL